MYVCICQGVTDRRIKQEVLKGATTLEDLQKRTGACTECQICLEQVTSILNAALGDLQK